MLRFIRRGQEGDGIPVEFQSKEIQPSKRRMLFVGDAVQDHVRELVKGVNEIIEQNGVGDKYEVVYLTNTAFINEAFYGLKADGSGEASLPAVIFAGQNMRQDSYSGARMTIRMDGYEGTNGPIEEISKLCEKNRVRLIRYYFDSETEQFSLSVDRQEIPLLLNGES